MYLLPEVNLQLRPALLQLKPGTRIVSHDWDMGDWAWWPDETLTVGGAGPTRPSASPAQAPAACTDLWVVPARCRQAPCGAAGRYAGDALRIADGQGEMALARGQTFARTSAASCS
jgi:hypothetical protein